MKKLFAQIIIPTIVFACIIWALAVLVSTPISREFLCKRTIEGRELYFYSNDGTIVYYYKKRMGVYYNSDIIVNLDSTLENEFEKLKQEFIKFDNLKCE